MNSMLRKLIALTLAVALLAGGPAAHASDALGHDLAAGDTLLNEGTELAAGTFWSDTYSDLRQENYVVYAPSERVTPIVTYGEATRALTGTLAAAQELEARGWRVVAGVNGDYYGTQHGVPLGSTMTEGALRNYNGDPYYAVGFRADGTAVIGDPRLSMRAAVNGTDAFPVFAFNHVRQSEYGIFLYDSRFNDRHTTGTSEPGVDVLCAAEDGALAIGASLTLRVVAVLPDATDTALEDGQYILTANDLAAEDYTAPLLALREGDLVTLTVESGSGDPAWNEVVNLLGAPELLVENGAVRAGLPTGSAPRTAIGQRPDGSLIFYTIDGRQAGYSIGASLTAVAMRLAELGCETAVALDGGGSTTLVATLPDETSARVVNTPSEGSVRAVSNHVFLVAPNTPGDAPDHVYLAASAARGLPGAQIALSAAVIDTNYLPVATGRALTFSADAGSVDADGVLTLPAEPGAVRVTASCGALSAQAVIEAAAPDDIVLRRGASAIRSLIIPPEGEVVLNARGVWNHLALAGGNDCFVWTYEGDGVTLLPDGYTLRAGKDAGAGTLTVSAAGRSASIPVTVATEPLRLLTGFEDGFEPFTDVPDDAPDAAELTPRLTLFPENDASRVKLGRASARLEYAFDAEGGATLPVEWAVAPGCDSLSLWLRGDGGTASLRVETDAGATEPVALSAEDWQLAVLSLPAGASRVTGLTLAVPDAAAGAVWLDQLVLTHGGKTDDTAPEASLSLDEAANALAGRAFDAADGAALETLLLTFDGAALPYERDARTGALAAALPAYDGHAHHVALTAGDASGNLARASLVLPAAADAEPAFPDAAGHWAAGAIDYLKRTGVSNGANGLYNPDARITRQEFAAMLYRYLAPEGDFGGVTLPFADAGSIAPWAHDAAAAMYALGVIGGAKDLDGRLCFNPGADITRQEAATMLGRLLEKGYAAPAPAYADGGEIPAWAAEHVAVLASLGVFDDFVSAAFAPAQPLTRAEMAAMLLRLR